jgi:hypothetical protein
MGNKHKLLHLSSNIVYIKTARTLFGYEQLLNNCFT